MTSFVNLSNTTSDVGTVIPLQMHLLPKLTNRITEFQRLLHCSCAVSEIAGPIA
jgi:hypothetical protein